MMKARPTNGDQPATQNDLAVWGGELTRRIDDIETRMATKDDLRELEIKMDQKMTQLKEEILHHFDAAVENIEQALKGANQDEISLLKDKQYQHEERIGVLERQAGQPPG